MAAPLEPGQPNYYPVLDQAGQAPPNIVKQGKLMKQGAGLFGSMSWKDRYFILKSNGVFQYYEDSKYSTMKGSIEVDKVYKTQRKDNKNLLLMTKERTWHLYSDKPSELDEWQDVLTQMTKREDAIAFAIQSADFAAIIGTGLQNSNMFGFVGDGLTVKLIGSANVLNKVTFSSFNYPPFVHDIKVEGNSVINLNNYITVIKLNGSHSYHIDLETKSLTDDCSLNDTLKSRNVRYPIIKHDFEDQPETKQSFNDNDIFVNMNLQCNYNLYAQQCTQLIGQASTGFFKGDSRKLQVNVAIDGSASIRPTYTILQKNNPTSYALWQEYCNQLLTKELENRIQQIRRSRNNLIKSGNRFHLLPHHVQSKFPLQPYYLTPISHHLLNKKCLCHVEEIFINKYGETLGDRVYVMAAIHFVKEDMYHYPPKLCDTILVDIKNRVMHRHHKTLVRELFRDNASIPWQNPARMSGHIGRSYDARISHLGRRFIQNAHYTNGPVRVELSQASPSQHQQGVHYCVNIYAKKSEKRLYYEVETTVSRVDESDDMLSVHQNNQSVSFTAPYMFDKPNTVIIQHRGGGDGQCFTSHLRVRPQALRRADAGGGQGPFAQWEALPRDGGHKIQLKSIKSGQYLRIHNNAVDVNGTGGKFTVFWVHREDGSVKLESEVECGRYIAVGKNNQVRTGVGGTWCNLRFFAKQDDCIIL